MEIMDRLSTRYAQHELLSAFTIARSTWQYRRQAHQRIDPVRDQLKTQVVNLFTLSRGSAGTRGIAGQLQQSGVQIGRYKVRALMKEASLVSTQRKQHRYRIADQASAVASNHLNRQFTVPHSNQVWCGDVTYIWSGRCWLYCCLLYTSPSPRDQRGSRMPSSA